MPTYDSACHHSPETPRTIQYDCVCCRRQEIVKAESYGLRSCATCQCIMQITIVEEGKVIDWGRAKIRVLARRWINVKVLEVPAVKEGKTPTFVGERLW